MTPFETDQPVYLQLRAMLATAILEGRHAEGSQLPSVRAFAAQTETNPLTVAKAYQTLQDEGFVEVRRGIGMFVAKNAVNRLRARERESFLKRDWPKMRATMQRLGINLAELTNAEHA